MVKNCTLIFMLCLQMFWVEPCSGQSVDQPRTKYKTQFSISSLLGGFVTIDNFEFSPGLSLGSNHLIIIKESFLAGGGIALRKQEDYTSMPLFALLGFRPQRKGGRHELSVKLGYAVQWSSIYLDFDDIDMPGGFYCSQQYALSLPLKASLDLRFLIAYSYEQFRFRLVNERTFINNSVDLGFHHLTIGMGLEFGKK